MKLNYKSLRQTLAEKIKADLKSGVWEGTLPGIRLLAARYGVSKRTCGAALKLLEHSGVLPKTTARTKRKLPELTSPKKPQRCSGILLVAVDISFYEVSQQSAFLDRLTEFWTRKGGFVRRVRVDFTKRRSPAKILADWCSGERVECIFFVEAPQSWLGVIDSLGIPVFLHGGARAIEMRNCVQAGFTAWKVIAAMFSFLKSRGHRSILIPVLKSVPGMRAVYISEMRKAFPDMNDAQLEDFVPALDMAVPGDWASYWAQSLGAIHPTCVVLNTACEAISLVSFCANAGIRVPDDVSVFVITPDTLVPWFTWSLSHVWLDTESDWRFLMRWIRDGFPSGVRHETPFTLLTGSSVADRSKR